MNQPIDEAVVIYSAPAIRTCGEHEIPAPDHRRLAAVPFEKTVVLMALLTGSPKRLAFRRDGACVMPIEPDGRYAPFPSLRAVMDSASEISGWLAEALTCRGVPPVTPAWLETVPGATEQLLDDIQRRVAGRRTIAIELRDMHGRAAAIVIPPRRALVATEEPKPHKTPILLDVMERYQQACDHSGDRVHLPQDMFGDRQPKPGDRITAVRGKMRRISRLTATRVVLKNADDRDE